MSKFSYLLFFFLSYLPLASHGQQTSDSIAAPVPYFSRERLTGDVGGIHSKLKQHGIIILLSTTHFYQGLMAGEGEHEFKYGGKGDAFLLINGTQLGLWKGISLISHGEIRFGNGVFLDGGNILPVNTALLFPERSGTQVALTSFFFNQRFGEKSLLMIGRLNFIDFLSVVHYYGGRGVEGFQNLAFTAVPTDARTTPTTTALGALLQFDLRPFALSFGAWDTRNSITKYSFGNLFDDGVSLSASAALITKFGGRPGKFAIGGTWSNLEATSLDEAAQLILPTTGEPLEKVKGSWVIDFKFDQNLIGPVEKLRKGWGFFSRISLADGNPNPFRWSAIGGFAGCPNQQRPYDRFGVGYYLFGLSPELKESVFPGFKIKNEQGAEIYYSFAPIPWFILTADVQLIDPFRKGYDNAWYGGLRAKIRI